MQRISPGTQGQQGERGPSGNKVVFGGGATCATVAA